MMERVKAGIAGFDKLIDGGFVKNSVNLISGGPGTGKTIFCIQFLINGGKEGEKGIYFSFEESEKELLDDLEGLNLDLKGLENKVKLIYIPLYSVGNIATVIKEEIDKFGPSRVVVDSVTALTMPMEDDFEKRKQIFKIRELLKASNCTSLLISEVNSDGMDGNTEFSPNGIESFVCDSLIRLHSAGIGGEGDRAIRIVKMRKTAHAMGPIPMTITKGGFKILKSRI